MSEKITDQQLSVEYRALSSLRPYPRNARSHPRRQVDQIKKSIAEFGFANPILIDPEGEIIAGHGRLLAAKELGLSEAPTIVLNGLSVTQKRALRLADNKIALEASWDLDLLKEELADLSGVDVDFDITLTGFSVGEVDIILADEGDPDDEIIPAVPTEPFTKPADIWELGSHRLGCGDGRNVAFLKEVIGSDGKIDAAFLDPPYNV